MGTLGWLALGVVGALILYAKRADVSGKRARELIAEGAILVDVRSPGEFASGHIEGAQNVPVSEIGARAKELEPRSRAVIVYCASGVRSAIAKRMLLSAGFVTVYNLGAMPSGLV